MNNKLKEQILRYNPFDERECVDKKVMLDFINNNSDVLIRENNIAHITVSAWIINKDRNKVLMIYHNIYNSWAWIGGHADGNENLLEVVKKEIFEETGLKNVKLLNNKIFGINIIPVDNHIRRGKIVNAHLHFDIEYLFEADENLSIRIKEDENSDIKWINIEDVLSYCNEEKMKPIYRKLIEKCKER